MNRLPLRHTLLLLICLISFQARANMASPWNNGSLPASPFINRHVSILHERIHIRPDAAFDQARYEVEYLIEVDTTGTLVPLLFYAPDLSEGFSAYLDGTALALEQVPDDYARLEGSLLEDFTYLFELDSSMAVQHLKLPDGEFGYVYITTGDLKFFSAPLEKGRHTLRVEYTANHYLDRSEWLRRYIFRYALSPAALWKSFGSLEVTLDCSDCPKPVRTNLGPPTEGDVHSVARWSFTALPGELIALTHQPKPSWVGRVLMALTPAGIAILFSILMVLFHLNSMWNYRKSYLQPKISWVAIVGGLIIPALALLIYMLAFPLIDFALGAAASQFHGYVFLVILLYPVIAPAYAIAMALADWQMRRQLKRRAQAEIKPD